ncbi:hypothetical protein MKW94_029242 [Papaver nudicaule]|uniref:Uncharacterized protein n=1 Tax=Papaver nudicaule TaxID=74823 RepID=A0AA42B1K6_PAPNU|nr:hypothetical protein [Papaver nudicaule]
MAKCSSLVIGFFFIVLVVVLQSAYVNGAGLASSPEPPEDYGECDPRRQVDIGNFTSCDMCPPACRSSYSVSICLLIPTTNTGAYNCKCCAPIKMNDLFIVPGAAATTARTSVPFLCFFWFLSFMLNRLFI